MELHAYTVTISGLLSVNKKYIVPRFQREYSWTKEQILELWNDIILNISIDSNSNWSHEEYFIGSLVLVGDNISTSMQIVDGQQRLTTLTILLSALCEQFKIINKDHLAKAIYENYIAGKDDDGNAFFKLENESPKPFFQTGIQHIDKKAVHPNTEEEKTLLNAYQELYSETSRDSLKKNFSELNLNDDGVYETLLKEIREQIVKYLKVIFITVQDEEDAYTIFETLNARGMNLSFVDLIKNQIFKDLKTEHPDDYAKTKWKKIRETIVSRKNIGNLETFIRHWWISRYSYVSADKVYKAFKTKWQQKSINSNDFLEDLVKDIELYVKTSSPQYDDWPQQEEKAIYQSLSALRIFQVTQQRPFILNLFKAKENQLITLTDLKKTLSFIESFHFLFNAICSLRPSGIEGSYSKAARKLFESKNKVSVREAVKELKEQFSSRIPSQEVFVDKFTNLKYTKNYTKNKPLIQYIFKYIELKEQETNEWQPYNMTLEHILAQSTSNEEFIGQMGNLLPLSSELNNNEARNKDPISKLEIYKKSSFKMTQEFGKLNITSWNETEITRRTEWLAAKCYEDWSFIFTIN